MSHAQATLSAEVLEKAESHLLTKLQTAAHGDAVRAVFMLTPVAEAQSTAEPESGLTVAEYRRHLLDRRRAAMQKAHAGTLEAMRDLGLKIRGGEVLSAVVVEGAAEEVAQALKLEGVKSGTLDQEIKLVRPKHN